MAACGRLLVVSVRLLVACSRLFVVCGRLLVVCGRLLVVFGCLWSLPVLLTTKRECMLLTLTLNTYDSKYQYNQQPLLFTVKTIAPVFFYQF